MKQIYIYKKKQWHSAAWRLDCMMSRWLFTMHISSLYVNAADVHVHRNFVAMSGTDSLARIGILHGYTCARAWPLRHYYSKIEDLDLQKTVLYPLGIFLRSCGRMCVALVAVVARFLLRVLLLLAFFCLVFLFLRVLFVFMFFLFSFFMCLYCH